MTELSSHIPSGDGNCEDRGAARAPMCGESKKAGRGKRSRGLGDDGGGWKSSKRAEVARAVVVDGKGSSFFHRQLEGNLLRVLSPALVCVCHPLWGCRPGRELDVYGLCGIQRRLPVVMFI